MLLTRKASFHFQILAFIQIHLFISHSLPQALASSPSTQTSSKEQFYKEPADWPPANSLTIMANLDGWQNRHPYSLQAQRDEQALYLLYLVAEPLFLLDFKQQWVCGLCKSLPTFANSQIEILSDPNQPYAMKMQLEFAPDRRWSDGKAITGHDLYFSWQVATSLEEESIGRNFYDRIEHVVVDPKDARRVNIFFREHTYFGEDWQHIFLIPKHIESSLWEKPEQSPQQYLETSKYVTAALTPGLYSGTYTLAKIKGNGVAQLKAHPFRPLPAEAWQNFVISPFKRNLAKEQRAQSLLITESLCPHSHCTEYQELLQDGLGPNQQVHLGDSNLYEQIALNLRSPILKDKRIRTALTLAIEKESILGFYQNEVIPAVSFMHPKSPDFSASISFLSPNMTESIQLLKDAEWHLDPKTGIRQKYGKPLTFTLTINKDTTRLKTANYLAMMWKKIGVNLQINIQDNALFYGKTLERMNFDGAMLFAWDIPVDSSLQHLFSSDAIPSIRNQYHGQNISGWNNRTVDKILQQLNLEFDPVVRKSLYEKLQKSYTEEIPAIPLYFYLKKAITPASLQGFRLTGNQTPSSAFASDWQYKAPVTAGK